MKKIMLSLIILFAVSNATYSQPFLWKYDEKKEYDIPIGYGNFEELKNAKFWQEMEEYYNAYAPKMTVIDTINAILANELKSKNISIEVIFGGWCGDSKEQIPAFMKVVEQTPSIKPEHLSWIGCDREKNAGNLNILDLYIEYFPTFIFYLENEEMCRIIETPKASIEEDFLDMLKRHIP